MEISLTTTTNCEPWGYVRTMEIDESLELMLIGKLGLLSEGTTRTLYGGVPRPSVLMSRF